MHSLAEPVEFDLEDAGTQADPYPLYPVLREERPVLESRQGGRPCWVISRREDVVAILMDPVTYSSRTIPVPMVLFLDRPEHDRIRAMVADRFTRRAVEAFADAMANSADAIINSCVAAGRCDIVESFASPLTIEVIAKLLGIAPGKLDTIREWSRDFNDYLFSIAVGYPPSEVSIAAWQGLSALMTDIADSGNYSSDGVMAVLVAQLRQGALTRDEFVNYALILFVAGHTTTTSLIAAAIYMLALRPGDLDRVRDEPDFAAPFVEEVLRTRPSFQRIIRVTTRDVELRGEHIPAGSDIRLLLGSANRDPVRFPDSERFDPERGGPMHSAFGHGIHTCLGSWLARLEARQALTAFARRVGTVILDPERPPLPITGLTFNEFGFETLPVILRTR